jgi:PKD repeat protein
MIRALFRPSSVALAAAVLTLTSACTMKSQEPPPLGGPSEFDLSLALSASPDQLQQDGASQSLITVTARDANSTPVRNLSIRAAMSVSGTPMDFGSLSARSIVTGNDGRAQVVYTAPPSPAVAPDNFTLVDILLTPLGSNYNNTNTRVVTIRLYPQGVVIPNPDLQPLFTMTPNAAQVGQTVLFDAGGSTGSIVSYQWNFGDGDRGSGRTATHSYDAAGTYPVTLTVADQYGRTEHSSQSFTVTQGADPTAAFVFSPTSSLPGQQVNFDASASRPAPGRTIVSYQWNFGDGTTGSGQTTSHAFPTIATYNVTLTVVDDTGARGTVTQGVTIGTGTNPTAAFTFSPTGALPGQQIFFNASTSRAAPGSSIRSYAWTFGDGTSDNGISPTHTYPAAGAYVVTLTVTDDVGRIGQATQTITIGSDLPTASFTVTPAAPVRGTPVILNGSASQAVPGRTITTYSWTFVAPQGATAPAPTTGPTVSVTFSSAGTYSITLTVIDSANRSGTQTQTVTVTP